MSRTGRRQIPETASAISTGPRERFPLLFAAAEEVDERILSGEARPWVWPDFAAPDGESPRGVFLLICGVIGLALGLASFLLNLCKSWELVRRLPGQLSAEVPTSYARAGILGLALVSLAVNALVQKRAVRGRGRLGVRGLDRGGGGLTEKGAAASWLGKVLCIYGVMLWAVYFLMTVWAGD